MLNLYRGKSTEKSTPGRMTLNGTFLCYTLEDVVRERWNPSGTLVDPKEWKVFGQTAIPSGKYAVVIDYSEHFHKLLPHLLGVPGFDGVRIHGGNKAEDTEGCVLVGVCNGRVDWLSNCAPAVELVMQKIMALKDFGPVNITIVPFSEPVDVPKSGAAQSPGVAV